MNNRNGEGKLSFLGPRCYAKRGQKLAEIKKQRRGTKRRLGGKKNRGSAKIREKNGSRRHISEPLQCKSEAIDHNLKINTQFVEVDGSLTMKFEEKNPIF